MKRYYVDQYDGPQDGWRQIEGPFMFRSTAIARMDQRRLTQPRATYRIEKRDGDLPPVVKASAPTEGRLQRRNETKLLDRAAFLNISPQALRYITSLEHRISQIERRLDGDA